MNLRHRVYLLLCTGLLSLIVYLGASALLLRGVWQQIRNESVDTLSRQLGAALRSPLLTSTGPEMASFRWENGAWIPTTPPGLGTESWTELPARPAALTLDQPLFLRLKGGGVGFFVWDGMVLSLHSWSPARATAIADLLQCQRIVYASPNLSEFEDGDNLDKTNIYASATVPGLHTDTFGEIWAVQHAPMVQLARGYFAVLIMASSLVLVLGFLGMSFFMRHLILAPLKRIQVALHSGSSRPIEILSRRTDEFGDVARIIRETYEQKELLEREISQRQEIEETLRETQEEIEAASIARENLAMNLHDDVVQALYAAGLKLEHARRQSETAADYSALNEAVREAAVLNRQVIDDIRKHLGTARSSRLSRHDFEDRLRRFSIPGQVDSTVEIDPAAFDSIPPVFRETLFFLAHELMSNSVRHTTARAVSCRLFPENGGFVLEVADDAGALAEELYRSNSGLESVRSRCRALGARLDIQVQKGRETKIRVILDSDHYS